MDQTYFKSRFAFDPQRDRVWAALCRYIQRDVPENARVLEIGAGYCHFINNILAKEKHAVDIFDQLRQYAGKDVHAHVQSCTNMPNFQADYFDVVFASNLFEHFERADFEKTLSEVWRVLRSGGRLIIVQPNFKYAYKEYFDDYTHVAVFTEMSLCDALMSKNFEIRTVIPRFMPFSMKSQLPKMPALISLYLNLPFRPMAKQMYVVAQVKK